MVRYKVCKDIPPPPLLHHEAEGRASQGLWLPGRVLQAPDGPGGGAKEVTGEMSSSLEGGIRPKITDDNDEIGNEQEKTA